MTVRTGVQALGLWLLMSIAAMAGGIDEVFEKPSEMSIWGRILDLAYDHDSLGKSYALVVGYRTMIT